MKQTRLAAIDIGSNSIRGIVVEVNKGGQFRILDDERGAVRLGAGLEKHGAITKAAWKRAIECLLRMKKIFDGYGVKGVEAIATSAVRRAVNGEAFIHDVSEQVGITARVIGGEEEAELATLSVLNNFDMEGVRYAIVDIGGGSVEVVTALGSHVEGVVSLELGAVALTEQFLSGADLVEHGDYRKMRRYIRASLNEAFSDGRPSLQTLIGSGGTMTAIASMVMQMRKEGYGTIQGYEVLRSEVVHLLAMLLRKDLKGRKGVAGLNPERADIIIAGVAVVDELMELFGANLLKVNERGIREGIILKGLRRHRLLPALPRQRNWREAVLELARSCHFDEGHSRQVARLSLIIFDSLAEHFRLGRRERQLLEAAALLHDIGYFISYAGHHKHSYHLIRHADLFAFTPRERELIANIARYHRKALPKGKHLPFARLSEQDQLTVRRLGGILRLSDGLDRSRSGTVLGLEIKLSEKGFLVRLAGPGDLSVELYGAKGKGDLFEAAFRRKLRVVTE
jgi:exopolyphosphatase/guanosine-5'-triphosphate,3'-diphosphate pyrophosphatase